jgi:hypothetical protein
MAMTRRLALLLGGLLTMAAIPMHVALTAESRPIAAETCVDVGPITDPYGNVLVQQVGACVPTP